VIILLRIEDFSIDLQNSLIASPGTAGGPALIVPTIWVAYPCGSVLCKGGAAFRVDISASSFLGVLFLFSIFCADAPGVVFTPGSSPEPR